ncbi:nucleotidyltransferase domain-containing protein [Halomarina rubra]|uniref:Nucleotidyltransferase domain-containing protein n=1 Tax=Halomarina rubra TaxID=2071873 RepID=A0ABD6AV19_9EURY|nr:hypothetical protein [Halomarina rubra]
MTYPTPVPHREALFALCDRLPDDLPWAVTASENLALRGFDVSPGDLDVTTTADGAYRIESLFSETVTRAVVPPAEAEAEFIRSHFGALSLHGTEVELMGDVEHRVGEAKPPRRTDETADGEWVPDPPVAETREFLTVEGRDVPVMPLAVEAAGYRARGDHDRAATVEARIEAADGRETDRDDAQTGSRIPAETEGER